MSAPKRSPRSAAQQVQSAYVLHSYAWSESSLILEVFARNRGRLVVAAKGAKKPYSQWRAVLMPFQRLNLASGKSTGEEGAEIENLRSAEWAGSPALLQGRALFSGFYLNELLLKLLARDDPHPVLFDAYEQTLPALGGVDDLHAQAALRAFELLLLRELGVLPELDRQTANLQALQPEGHYSLLGEAGIAPARGNTAALSGVQWAGLQAALASNTLPAVQAAVLPLLAGLRPNLRETLHYHLGTHRLRTRQVAADVQRLLERTQQASA